MSRRIIPALCAVLLLVPACTVETDEPGATTTAPSSTAGPPPATSAPMGPTTTVTTPIPPSTGTPTTLAPTTTAVPGPGERVLALSRYQMAMAGSCIEIAAMEEFAQRVNTDWDSQQAALKAAGKKKERDALLALTEQALTDLVAWVEQLHDEIIGMEPPAGGGATYADIEIAAAAMQDAAATMLSGLLMPASAESVPGTARRLALDAFIEASADLDDAAASTLALDPAVSEYELTAIGLRLDVSGLRTLSEELNDAWDRGDLVYERAGALFAAFAESTRRLVTRVESAKPPSGRVTEHAVLRNAAIDLNASAEAMLDGLLTPSDQEAVPGTARLEALATLRIASGAFDRAAAAALGIGESNWSPLVGMTGPHTEPPDVTPPVVEISKPADHAGTPNRTVTVQGTAEANTLIELDEQIAFVGDSGSWSFKVKLEWGHNPMTLTAVDLAGNELTMEYELHRGYRIEGNRIGTAKLGDRVDDVMAWFTGTFGDPDDVEEVFDWEAYGWYADSYLRFVWWQGPRIFLVFGDNPYIRSDGEVALMFWSTASDRFVTAKGIHVGSTLEELQAAYGSNVEPEPWDTYCANAGDFWVPSSGDFWLSGHVTGPPFDADSQVTYLAGGAGPECD